MLSHLENFTRMMSGDKPERLPLEVGLTEPAVDMIEAHTGSRDCSGYLGTSFKSVGAHYPHDETAWRAAFASLGAVVPADAIVATFGVTHMRPPKETLGSAYHLLEMLHPFSVIQDVPTLESLPWPDLFAPGIYDHIPAFVEQTHAEGKACYGGMACTAFESAWYVRGMDNLFMDLIEGNGISDWLLDYFTDRSVESVTMYVKQGVDMILLGDDVASQRGMLMAPAFWREHLKPRLKKVVDAVREASPRKVQVAYHSDGDVTDILDGLVEVGIDILNPIQPECLDVDRTIGQYKDRLGFWGIIGTQTTLPFGTPDDVRAAVANCADWARKGARIIVAPTHVVEPDVPWENLDALVQAVRTTVL